MYAEKTPEFDTVETSNGVIKEEIIQFLHSNGLGIDDDVGQFVIARADKQLIACAGLAGNTLKCIAVHIEWRGTSLGLQVIREAEYLANQNGDHHLFLLTCPDNVKSFRGCGFYPLATLENKATLMENTPVGIHRYCKKLRADYFIPAAKIGAIVMNANPFTLGHQFLIEQASRACNWLHVFVVEENLSQFSFNDRIAMVRDGVKHLSNVTEHPGSRYIISRGTFPGYFLKEKQVVNDVYSAIDLIIFRRYIAPSLGITHRFVGTEPYCKVTAQYNRAMHHWLEEEFVIPANAITVHEIDRKTDENNYPISASAVRSLLNKNKLSVARNIVPESTMPYLHNWLRANHLDLSEPPLTGNLMSISVGL
ncbi:[citrate (pro-3S)-lyase] ligase [Kosakonia sacchari]|nr:[citrate (pro-3S)-lyase] ligase [Kosakonia sacchari]